MTRGTAYVCPKCGYTVTMHVRPVSITCKCGRVLTKKDGSPRDVKPKEAEGSKDA